MMRNLQSLCCYFFITLDSFSRGELFTALSDIEPLLTTHKRVANDLHDYITKEEERLHILKRYLKVYQREHVKAMENIPNYLGNPINAFTLIKRMTTDLEFVQLNIDLGAEHASNIGITQYEGATYPSAEDLRGAALALTRLQETYLLNVEDLAKGILNGAIYGSAMSASDCFELGKALYIEKDYTNCLAWMSIALRKYHEENYSYPFSQVDILEYISFAHYLLGDVKEAEEWTKKLVAIDPTHARKHGNTTAEQEERRRRLKGHTGEDFLEEEVEIDTPEELSSHYEEFEIYKALCRGEMDISPLVAKLTCRYLTENHPFLRLAPLKMEYKYRDPDIVLFHEVLSDDEIEHLKELAQPRFQRALVRDSVTSELIAADYRISKSAWLTDAESPVVERVTRRIADFTGLDMDTAEPLQVINYGIGGHYMPHYDFTTKHDVQFADTVGNRIATVIFYMSDVAQGGATVFTELGLSLFPVRGAAAVWFNLHASGEGDLATRHAACPVLRGPKWGGATVFTELSLSLFPVRGAAAVWLNLHASGEGDLATRHAACPVLRGSKWVSNKWIHLVGQEFRKPCGLEYQTEDIMVFN